MNGFQKIVLISAIIILIVALIFIGMAIGYSQDDAWPPIVPQCPDYWQADGSGNNSTCTNVMNLGTCNSVMNFNKAPFTGDSGTCAKYNWATNCGVTWDAITYGVSNPCQSTS
jgi:hypothetical protein